MLPLVSLGFPILYVASLYVHGGRSRDDPLVIKSRMVSSILVSLCCSWIPAYLLLFSLRQRLSSSSSSSSLGQGAKATSITPSVASELLILLGMQKKGLLASVGMPLALLLMLFSSSFLLLWYDGMLSVLLPLDFDLRTLRSLVVAPITEELCFRSGLISYLLLKGISLPVCIWMSPLLFAVAHVHHVFERVTHKEMPLRSALMAFVLQASYTTIFGWLAAYLFVRSGRVLAPVTAHVFCNWMGLPNFSRMLSHPRRRSLVFCLLMGILGFSVMLKPCTRPELYGYERGESYAGYAIALVENS